MPSKMTTTWEQIWILELSLSLIGNDPPTNTHTLHFLDTTAFWFDIQEELHSFFLWLFNS